MKPGDLVIIAGGRAVFANDEIYRASKPEKVPIIWRSPPAGALVMVLNVYERKLWGLVTQGYTRVLGEFGIGFTRLTNLKDTKWEEIDSHKHRQTIGISR